MPLFRYTPIVEACQIDDGDPQAVVEWIEDNGGTAWRRGDTGITVLVDQDEEEVDGQAGDWVIHDHMGFFLCADVTFTSEWEQVVDEADIDRLVEQAKEDPELVRRVEAAIESMSDEILTSGRASLEFNGFLVSAWVDDEGHVRTAFTQLPS